MREPINLQLVQPDTPEFEETRRFAQSFDHQVWPGQAVAVVRRGGRIIGFANFILHPIGLPAFHYDASPRDILEGAAALRHWQQGANRHGSVIIGVNEHARKMPDSVIAALGFRPMDCALYLSDANT